MTLATCIYLLALVILAYKVGRWLIKGDPPAVGKDWL